MLCVVGYAQVHCSWVHITSHTLTGRWVQMYNLTHTGRWVQIMSHTGRWVLNVHHYTQVCVCVYVYHHMHILSLLLCCLSPFVHVQEELYSYCNRPRRNITEVCNTCHTGVPLNFPAFTYYCPHSHSLLLSHSYTVSLSFFLPIYIRISISLSIYLSIYVSLYLYPSLNPSHSKPRSYQTSIMLLIMYLLNTYLMSSQHCSPEHSQLPLLWRFVCVVCVDYA